MNGIIKKTHHQCRRFTGLTKFCRRVYPHLSTLANSAIENHCVLCDLPTNTGFCSDCQRFLPWNHRACRICARGLTSNGICGHCQTIVPIFNATYAAFTYQAPISNTIQHCKYHTNLIQARALSLMLAKYINYCDATLPEVILPIPLHPRRLAKRGFNQSLELSLSLSALLDVPVDRTSLVRIRNTDSQAALDETERRRNVRNAFSFKSNTPYKHAVLLDDVVTSGSTVNAAAGSLRRAGIERIDIWAIAKT